MKLSASDRAHQVSFTLEVVFNLGSDAEEEFKHYNQGIKWKVEQSGMAFWHFHLMSTLI